MNTRKITGIVIHCSGTPNGQWVNAHEIDQAHLSLGFKRDEAYRQRFNSPLHAIGYHFVIYPNGAIATGRHLDEPGQHTKTHNLKTIAICLIGTSKFTAEQWQSLRDVVPLLDKKQRGTLPICRPPRGHMLNPDGRCQYVRVAGCSELPGEDKNSPGFSVTDWLEGDMQPLPDHVFKVEK